MLKIRNAEIRDLENTYRLFMDKTVRATAKNPKEITFEEHKVWFLSRIKKRNFFILEDGSGNFVGQVRVDDKNGEKVLSIELVEASRAKGYGKFALEHIMQDVVYETIVAYVRKENTASMRLFEGVGFNKSDTQNGCWKYWKSTNGS